MQKMSLENEELVLHLANSQDVQEEMRVQMVELQVLSFMLLKCKVRISGELINS